MTSRSGRVSPTNTAEPCWTTLPQTGCQIGIGVDVVVIHYTEVSDESVWEVADRCRVRQAGGMVEEVALETLLQQNTPPSPLGRPPGWSRRPDDPTLRPALDFAGRPCHCGRTDFHCSDRMHVLVNDPLSASQVWQEAVQANFLRRTGHT